VVRWTFPTTNLQAENNAGVSGFVPTNFLKFRASAAKEFFGDRLQQPSANVSTNSDSNSISTSSANRDTIAEPLGKSGMPGRKKLPRTRSIASPSKQTSRVADDSGVGNVSLDDSGTTATSAGGSAEVKSGKRGKSGIAATLTKSLWGTVAQATAKTHVLAARTKGYMPSFSRQKTASTPAARVATGLATVAPHAAASCGSQ
jgi:hypothetical protein